mgnify:CR=1 FL=1
MNWTSASTPSSGNALYTDARMPPIRNVEQVLIDAFARGDVHTGLIEQERAELVHVDLAHGAAPPADHVLVVGIFRQVIDRNPVVEVGVRRLAVRHAPARTTYAGPALTPRETEVLALTARGMSNPEIAGELVLGVETVRTHVANVLAKLGARDRTQAVVIAYETGLVPTGWLR